MTFASFFVGFYQSHGASDTLLWTFGWPGDGLAKAEKGVPFQADGTLVADKRFSVVSCPLPCHRVMAKVLAFIFAMMIGQSMAFPINLLPFHLMKAQRWRCKSTAVVNAKTVDKSPNLHEKRFGLAFVWE